MTYQNILYETDERLAFITLNYGRPLKNHLSYNSAPVRGRCRAIDG